MVKRFITVTLVIAGLGVGFYASASSDIKNLQIFLNSHGYPVAQAGPGSLGNETNYFGLLTKKALADFQAANGWPKSALGSGKYGPWTKSVIAAILEKEKSASLVPISRQQDSVPPAKSPSMIAGSQSGVPQNSTANSSPAGQPSTSGSDGGNSEEMPVVGGQKFIQSFDLFWSGGQVQGIINSDSYTITAVIPTGADISKLKAVVGVLGGITVVPASGTVRDFTNPVTYTATDSHGSVQTYVVVVISENSG
jgi:hypothetical protein